MVEIEVRTSRRTDMVPITDAVRNVVREAGVDAGLCTVYVPHTTAAVTVNENADPTVPRDILHVVDRIIPFGDIGYGHAEGNSAAHIKASLFGTSETIPIRNGRLALGTWQGIFFCEFDGPRTRRVSIKVLPG
ncbi:MAG: secondary thiamine-phosphate synthase enzyme YjbQ [Candidatus Latescibacteria bacterium]|jgi:secondary thiamine-phosphate synthase enzyme|nr:secondary thiamine-phosphate synthase enzyme YjbQ [Candidatus Latescibacterota bacterium]